MGRISSDGLGLGRPTKPHGKKRFCLNHDSAAAGSPNEFFSYKDKNAFAVHGVGGGALLVD